MFIYYNYEFLIIISPEYNTSFKFKLLLNYKNPLQLKILHYCKKISHCY